MLTKWKVGSLFAGVGGFDLGFEQTGRFESVWMSEWDKHAESVLRRRFPNARQLGDITKVDPAQLESVDVVVGGFPCQDLSVAGKRAGLAGERSGLFHEFVRIVRGLPRRPSFVVVENVPGMLSSQQGRDFAVVLSEVVKEWGAVSVAWRVLDSQYFGVAQRRRRVFLVLDLAGERAPEVLALEQGSVGDPPSRIKTQPQSPEDARGCAERGRPCFSRHDQSGTCREVNVAPCLSAKADNCCDIPMVLEQQPFSPHGHYRYENSDQSATLQDRENRLAGHTHLVAQTFRKSARPTSVDTPETWVPDEVTNTLNTLNTFDVGDVRATTVAVESVIPIQDGREIEKRQNGLGVGTFGDPSYTVDTTGAQSVALRATTVAVQGVDLYNQTLTGDVHVPLRTAQGHGAPAVATTILGPVTHTLTNEGHDASEDGTGRGTPVVAVQLSGDRSNPSVSVQEECAYCLPANPMSDRGQSVATSTIVRRLTPDECCILQGFPPDWNDGQADSHRYKQMGNAVTVTVAKWIAERMARLM